MTPSRARPTSTSDAASAASALTALRDIADALCRAAQECHEQYSRSARVGAKTGEPVDSEDRAIERICSVCDEHLAELTLSYERATAQLHPAGADDERWWRRANALWLASREYVRRRQGAGERAKRVSSQHAAGDLESLHLEFELEASALLALRQACDAYCRERPGTL